MQYSLTSRFQGALLGAAIAEAFDSNPGKSKPGLTPSQDTQLRNSAREVQGRHPFQLNQAAWLCAETLINTGDLNAKYWQHPQARQHQTQSIALSPGETLVGVIPVSLFFHENEVRLRQRVVQAIEVGHASLELQSAALAVAFAIAQCLREQLDPSSLIPQTIAYLNQPPNSSLIEQLEQVQRLLEQRASLETALLQVLELQSPNSQLISASVALAFYCFLSTLEDYPLTTTRAAWTGCQPLLTAILAGAFSGAYNSTAGIPPAYRLVLLQQDVSQGSQRRKIEEIVIRVADQLLATWSGAYEPTHAFDGTDLPTNPAVAAPGIIRPR